MPRKGRRFIGGSSLTMVFILLLFSLFYEAAGVIAMTLSTDKLVLSPVTPHLEGTPIIFTISPQAGRPGDMVNIYGGNFGYGKQQGRVSFYREPVEVAFWSDSLITVVAPEEISGLIVPVQVTTMAGGSDFLFFSYLALGEDARDLAISFSAKSSYKAGQKNIRIQVTVSLSGSLPEGATVASKMYLASGRFPDPEDIRLWDSYAFTPRYYYGWWNKGWDSKAAIIDLPDVTPGQYYILADLNASYTHTDYGTNNSLIVPIVESSYANNWAILPVKITDPSDTSPVAGITINSQSKAAYEGETLHLFSTNPRKPVKVFFSAIRSTFTGNYATYRWALDNRPLTSEVGFSYYLRPGRHKVSLEVMDKYRRRGRASTTIIVENGADLSGKGPYAPQDVQQFKADGVSPLAYHDITYQNMVYLKARVVSPDGEPVMLQAELRTMEENFTGEANYESPFLAPSGEVAFVATPGLKPAAYQWRLRAVDARGNYSPWLSLDPYNPAFYALTPDIP